MESQPLQLFIHDGQNRVAVSLMENTIIIRGGREIDAGELKEGMKIQIEGGKPGTDELHIEKIEIID
jgi:hypothetical protein